MFPAMLPAGETPVTFEDELDTSQPFGNVTTIRKPLVIERLILHDSGAGLIAVNQTVHHFPEVADRFDDLCSGRYFSFSSHRIVQPFVVLRVRCEHAVIALLLHRRLDVANNSWSFRT